MDADFLGFLLILRAGDFPAFVLPIFPKHADSK
jgi:hypothetical protein